MALALQKPQIIRVEGSTLYIAHPRIKSYTKTSVNSPFTAADTNLSVKDNNNIENGDFLLLGELNGSGTEEAEVNNTVSRGNDVPIKSNTNFDHDIDTLVTNILERQIKIYSASTDGGSGSLLTTIDIDWSSQFTEYTVSSQDNFYFVKFSDGTTDGPKSDYIPASGLPDDAAGSIIFDALDDIDESIGDEITFDMMLSWINEFQTDVIDEKDWGFDMIEDISSLEITQNEIEYDLANLTYTPKYTDSRQAIHSVRIGSNIVEFKDVHEIEEAYEGTHQSRLDGSISAGDTEIKLDDVSEFNSSGTVKIEAETIEYGSVDDANNKLTGIPSSGSGSISNSHDDNTIVWQGVNVGLPEVYTIYDGKMILGKAPDSDYDGWALKLRYFKEPARVQTVQDTLDVPFIDAAPKFVASRVEMRKGNNDKASNILQVYEDKIGKKKERHKTPVTSTQEYWSFTAGKE